MIHLGDITKINGYEIPPVDVIVGGSPCQDLSVAGKRKGLAGERSGLFMEQIRVVKEMRDNDRRNNKRTGIHVRPRFLVWENVTGALSSGTPKGADFAAVIEEIIKVAEPDADLHVRVPERGWTKSGCYYAENGRWSVAWRVHDAQFWGVAQRRRRIALIADFGGLSAPEILFERKGLSGDFGKSEETREDVAEDAERCIDSTGNGIAKAFGISSYDSNGMKSANPHSGFYEAKTSRTLDLNGGQPSCNQGGIAIVGFNRERCGAVTMNDAMPTLQAAAGESGNNKPMVAISFQERAGKPGGGKGILIQGEHVGALSTLNNQAVCATKKEDMLCLNDQGGQYMDVSVNKTGTLRASAGGHLPIVVNKATDLYNGQITGDVAATLTTAAGVSNGSGPKVICIEGNGSRESHKGDGWKEAETMYTLNTVEQHAVVYSVDQGAGKSSVSVGREVSPTLATTHGSEPAVIVGVEHEED